MESPESAARSESISVISLEVTSRGSRLFQGEMTVEPRRSLIDEKISITVKGLSSGESITIAAKLIGDSNEELESYGHFKADETGRVCLEEQTSLAGTYTGVDTMGLLWSMQLSPGQRKGQRLSKKDPTKPYNIHLQLFHDHVKDFSNVKLKPLAHVTFEKWYMARGVRRIPVREGRLRGTLFIPPGKGPFPGIIDLFGTTGGLIEFKASLLASHGFAALALAYFAYDDLPKVITEVELEYFFEACDWMLAHYDVMSHGLGLMGVSKGAELVLTIAAHRKDIRAVVGISPSHAIVGIPLKYQGKPTDFIKFEPDLVKVSENGTLIFKETYPPDSTDAPGRTAAIKVENIQGDILLICGDDDESMMTTKMVEKITSRLRKYGRESKCTVRCYPGTGHLIEPPYAPPCTRSYHKTYRMSIEWGGKPRQHAMAQEDSWKHILNFFSTKLAFASYSSRL